MELARQAGSPFMLVELGHLLFGSANQGAIDGAIDHQDWVDLLLNAASLLTGSVVEWSGCSRADVLERIDEIIGDRLDLAAFEQEAREAIDELPEVEK